MSKCPDCGGEHGFDIVGRPIAELQAILIERIKTITGSWVDPDTGTLYLGVGTDHVATIVWPEALNDLLDVAEATRQ